MGLGMAMSIGMGMGMGISRKNSDALYSQQSRSSSEKLYNGSSSLGEIRVTTVLPVAVTEVEDENEEVAEEEHCCPTMGCM